MAHVMASFANKLLVDGANATLRQQGFYDPTNVRNHDHPGF
jgi:hypothetical protein